MLSVLSQIVSELALIFLYPVLSLAAQFVPKWDLHGNGDGQTIIIVERWLSINLRHLYWKYYLERKGYSVFLANFPIYKGGFQESALHLEKYIQRHNLTDITIVGISSGALTSLIYLQSHNGWERVSKFISVGAPFQGTWAALILVWCESGRELLPMSKFLQHFLNLQFKNLNRIYCIKAKFDEMVPFGSVLPGAHKIVLKVVGHNNLHLRVRATYRKIAEIA